MIQAKESNVFFDVDVFLRMDPRVFIHDDNSEIKNIGTLFVPIGGLKVHGMEASLPLGSGHDGVVFIHLGQGQVVDRHAQK